MTSTIDLAREAGMEPNDMTSDWSVSQQNLETFRALCVAERDKELLGVGMEPVRQYRKVFCADWYDGYPDQHDGNGPYETRSTYTATQLAAARLHGQEEWKTRAESIKGTLERTIESGKQRIAELEQQLAQERSKREPLTDEQIKTAVLENPFYGAALMAMMRDEVMVEQVRKAIEGIARAIERAHGIGEQG